MKFFGFNILYDKRKKLEELQSEVNFLINKFETIMNELEKKEESIKTLIKEQKNGNPYLAKIISDFFYIRDNKIAELLENKKPPALKAAEEVRKHAYEKRELRRMLRITYNRIKLYENLFPFISDLEPDDIDFLLKQKTEKKNIEENDDPVREFVPEYDRLSEEERNQRALERYLKNRNKSNWEIGKMYERYIGYLYEKNGYNVEYIGIEKGFDDLGRDLICKKGNKTLVVQCKHWASSKEIKEAHINQLYGTTVKYFVDKFKERSEELKNTLFPDLLIKDEINIKPVLVTSTKLSKTAQDFADALGIEVVSEKSLGDYPMIKCNFNSQTGENIYHLPFDLQYDKVMMQNEKRKYVKTVKEAMDLGCRRAFKWNSKN